MDGFPFSLSLFIFPIASLGQCNTISHVLGQRKDFSNYAAVAADTFSSELGILSKSRPRLLTSWNLREVPPGTNGGVTLLGTGAGLLGSLLIAITSSILLPFCSTKVAVEAGWSFGQRLGWILFVTALGGFGSLLDSALGGWLQASVVDAKTGKVVEGPGGRKVCFMKSRGRIGRRTLLNAFLRSWSRNSQIERTKPRAAGSTLVARFWTITGSIYSWLSCRAWQGWQLQDSIGTRSSNDTS